MKCLDNNAINSLYSTPGPVYWELNIFEKTIMWASLNKASNQIACVFITHVDIASVQQDDVTGSTKIQLAKILTYRELS